MSGNVRRFVSITLVASIACAGGCAHGVRGGKKTMRFAPWEQEKRARALYDGDYFIVVRRPDSKELEKVPHTTRQLLAGEEMGFVVGDDGGTVAFAHNWQMPIGGNAHEVKYYAWYTRDLPHDTPPALQTLGDAASVTLLGAGLLAGSIGLLLLDSSLDDDCHHPQHRHHRSDQRH